MDHWFLLQASGRGQRTENQDFLNGCSVRYRRRRFTLLVANDGVGGRPSGKACATAIGTAVQQEVRSYLHNRRSRLPLGRHDWQCLAKRLNQLQVKGAPSESATTMLLALFDHKRGKNGHQVLVLWAGDSRAYLACEDGRFLQITSDHHDDEGRLTSFYTGDGKLNGVLSGALVSAPALFAIAASTDGVHERCTTQELHLFLLSCIERQVARSDELETELSSFLAKNVSDNFSLSLLYHPLNERRLLSLASRLLRKED